MFTDEEKKLLLSFFLALLFACLFCQAVYPVEYKITEAQLQTLEMHLQNLKTNNQSLQSQANELKTQAKTLNEQLKTERDASLQLNEYCSKLEIRLSESDKAFEKLGEEKHQAELKLQEQKKIFWIMFSISLCEFFIILIFIFLKIKKIF